MSTSNPMNSSSITPEQRLHQQLMGRSNSHLNLVDPSLHQISNFKTTTIIDSLGQSYSSPYHSANALISSSSNLSLQSNRPVSRHHSIHNPSPTPSQQHLPFDPDHEAELLRRRKLEARRSMSSNRQSLHHASSRTSFATAPHARSRRQSVASSIASNATSPLPQQRTLSPQPQSRRLLGSGSPLAQVHRPSPLRSASTPTVNLSESEQDPSERPPPVPSLSSKSRQKLIKAEQRKIKKELIESERIRLNIPERRRSIWFNPISSGTSSNEKEKENKSKVLSPKKVVQEERDPFRKSVLQVGSSQTDSMRTTSSSSPHKSQTPPSPQSSEVKSNKKKPSSTLSRLFGTLLSTHNHSKSITVVDPRSPILSNSHSKRLNVMESLKRSTMNKRRPVVPVLDPSSLPLPSQDVFVPSKPSESVEEEEGSGESVPRIGKVKSGNGVMVLVVKST